MDQKINQILTNNKVDGRHFTHGSMGTIKASYQMNNKTRDEFFDMYSDSIKRDDRDVIEVGLGEVAKIHPFIPVLVDLDIKIKQEDAEEILEDTEKLYTEEQVENVITIYQVILRSILNNVNDKDLTCVLLEKDAYIEEKGINKYIKNGFHLHFPYIFMSKKDQKNHLIPRVKEEFKNKQIFDNLFEDSSSVVDSGYLSSTWLLYGSSKGENKEPYKITKVYDADCEEITLCQAFKSYQIFDSQEKLIKIDRFNIEKYLPRILSIIPHNRIPKEIKTNIISPAKQKLVEERKKIQASIDAKEAVKIAQRLVPMISSTRADDHNEWMTIGWALFNCTEGSDDGFDVWNKFTQRAEEPRGEERCMYEWGIMKRNSYSYTLGTIHYLASQDSPEEYKKFKLEKTEKLMNEAIDGSHNDIAKILKSEYSTEYVCASVDAKCWFRFLDNTWEQMEGGIYLRKKISDELLSRFDEASKTIWEKLIKAHNDQDQGEKAKWEKKNKQIQTLRKNLKSAPFKNNVMRECSDEFYNPEFKEKLDTNPYLIAFQNGVYDLERNIFRKGRPEDFLSKKMSVNYREFDKDDDEVQEVKSFLEKLFPDNTLYRYFLDLASDVFVGGNHQKKVYFWLGCGDNGKSVLQKLMEIMLGPLAIKFDTSLITGKKPGQGSAHAELARAGGGVRWATLDEPNKDEQINSGVMKKLSGNDSFWARDLFEKGKDTREIVPLFKLIFICNKLPHIKYSDKATWNRVRVLPFESTFLNANDPTLPNTYEEQLEQKKFPKDLDLEKKLPTMAEAFAWLLLDHRLNVSAREEPEKVMMATNMYRKQSDIYRQFIEENIVEDGKSSINLSSIYATFIDWFRQCYPGQSVHPRPDVQDYFETIWGTCDIGKKWPGYRLRTAKDDMKKGEEIVLGDDEEELSDEEELLEDDDNELPFMG